MANWYYYDNDGQKQGPYNNVQIKGFAEQGTITPETIIENEGGQSMPAGKAKGLTFGEAAQPKTPPVNQTSLQDVLVPFVEGIGKSPRKITAVGITAVLIVGVIGLAVMPATSSKRTTAPPPPSLAMFDDFEAKTINNTVRPRATPKPSVNNVPVKDNELFSAEIIAKQIDALLDENRRKGLSIELSPSEKQAVVDFFILWQKTSGKKHHQTDLDSILGRIRLARNMSGGRTVDIYGINRAYINIRKDSRMAWFDKYRKETDEIRKKIHWEIYEMVGSELELLEGMLPESNRLSGNRHDAVEMSRLNAIQRATEVKELFR